MNLNVDSWKEFQLTDVFVVKGGFYNKKPEHSIDGRVPFLASTESNNGVTEYYSLDDIKSWDKVGNADKTLDKKIYKGNCIAVTVNGSVCNAFYQSEDFTCSHDITALYPIQHELSPMQALFVCTVIMKEKYRWSYGRKPHDVKKFGKSIIKLPITENGNVDWDFMDKYIKSLHYKPLTTKNKKMNVQELKVSEWQEFYISRTATQSGLFEIENCKCGSAGNLDDGDIINYIGAKKNDNGVMRKVVREESLVSKGNGIMFICDGEGSVGYTNYMNEDFIGSTTTSIGYDEALNPYVALFLVSVLDKEKFKYSYGRKYRAHINEVTIKLPIQRSTNGHPIIDNSKKYSKEGYLPDWSFMEHYIKALPYGDRL